ncbi:MAG: hypothetical protein RIB65_06640 [Ilumatobacter fluminis]|uniref:hypothetical protein n=1 Tax=Ilumatobacter fluminis TaxID=467091 RepID=UPI0032EC31C6
MSIVAVTGDASTTTSVALAAAWASGDDLVLVEADPSGGDAAAWFDMPVEPSLSSVVTRVLDGAWPDIERLTRLAGNGLRVLPAPSSLAEATQAVDEAARTVVPVLSAMRTPVAIVDVGRHTPLPNPFLGAAAITVVVHRQSTQSARAAAVRLQRLIEHVDRAGRSTSSVVVAVIGAEPFSIAEIERFLADGVGATPVVGLPVDELAAAVLAGRTGVSAKRLGRLPLIRAARDLAVTVDRSLQATGDPLWKTAR